MKTSRRNFIAKSILAGGGISAGMMSMLNAGGQEVFPLKTPISPGDKKTDPITINVFSKNLQWLEYKELAEVAAETGFDGIDLTVRPLGHVLPENVESDLPKAMDALLKSGLNIYEIATSINNADDPLTGKILKTASSLGIRHYRMNWKHYDETKSTEDNLKIIEGEMSALAELNEKYSISGEYQNHSGTDNSGIYFGGVVWDLFTVLKKINSPWLGSQYDIYHAMAESINTWPAGLKLIGPYIRSVDIKDFIRIKKDGIWITESVPLGQGEIDFNKYFTILKQQNFSGPVSIHFEYPLGGAESGSKTIKIKREEIVSAMKKDLETLKKYLNEAALT